MDLNVLFVLLVTLVVQSSAAKKKVHLKIHVPEFLNHHHHTRYVYLHDDKPHKKVHIHYHPPPKVEVHYGPKTPFFDGAKSWKVMKSEKYETETIDNPNSDYPGNKYIVKSKYKVREKLPFDDATIGYDQEYEYPLSETEHDFNKNKDNVDFHSSKSDPFYGGDHEPVTPEFKAEVIQEIQKGPKSNYHYQYPSNDYDYVKTVHLINKYVSQADPEHQLAHDDFESNKPKSKKTKEQNYNDVDIEYGPGPGHEQNEFDSYNDPGPSDHFTYANYKTDGPSFDYVNSDSSDLDEHRVPQN